VCGALCGLCSCCFGAKGQNAVKKDKEGRQRMTCDTSFGVRICVSFSAFPLYPHGHTVATVAKQRFMFYLL